MALSRFRQFDQHSQRKEYFTVCVSNLQETVKKEDLENHFLHVDRNCRPKASAPVLDSDLGSQTATVTFLTDRAQRRSQVEKFMQAPLLDSQQNVSSLLISEDWSGVRTLAQSHNEPSVEYTISKPQV